jgi:putative DNA primase/helicase
MIAIPSPIFEIAPIELPPVHGVIVGVGIGKTEAAVQIIAGHCLRSTVALAVVYAVPTHKLGDELIGRFTDAGLTAGVWRGRLAADPEKSGGKMCLKPDAMKKAISIGMPIQQTMCRYKDERNSATCEHFSYCPYQSQAGQLCKKQVVIIPHDSLFYEMPDIGTRNMLVIDEAFWSAGLRGV